MSLNFRRKPLVRFESVTATWAIEHAGPRQFHLYMNAKDPGRWLDEDGRTVEHGPFKTQASAKKHAIKLDGERFNQSLKRALEQS
jgi:hypothetical protein|tara:strand:- start:81 stop:335 length:255 start_codon:yes stop_codon:yes gene_type:complete